MGTFIFVVIAVLMVAGGGFWWWKRRQKAEEESGPVHAFVWLLDRPRSYNAVQLAALVSKALNLRIEANPEQIDEANEPDGFIVGEPPFVMLQIDMRMYLVNSFNKRYIDNPEEVAEQITDPRMREAVLGHTAWVSADLLGQYDEEGTKAGYQTIGKIAAALMGDDCIALLCTINDDVHFPSSDLAKRLRSEDPLAQLSETGIGPIVHIEGDDPRMAAAVEQARREWPAFVDAFDNRSDGEIFSIKGPLGKEPQREFIWISVTAIEGDLVCGTIGNDPIHRSNGRLGDKVTMPIDELNDWAILRSKDAEPEGMFTVKVLAEVLREKKEAEGK